MGGVLGANGSVRRGFNNIMCAENISFLPKMVWGVIGVADWMIR